jgi:hypothetical protein
VGIVAVRLTIGAVLLRVMGTAAPPSMEYSAATTLPLPVVVSSPVALIATSTEPFVRLGFRTSALVVGPALSRLKVTELTAPQLVLPSWP